MEKKTKSSKKKSYPCPRCEKLIEYSLTNEFRPFCSERCRLLDTAAWVDESYRIPTQNSGPPDPENPEDEV